jgi:hypothetical protein
VLDCGIEQLVGLLAGDAGMLENVLVKFRIGQLQLKESEVACQRPVLAQRALDGGTAVHPDRGRDSHPRHLPVTGRLQHVEQTADRRPGAGDGPSLPGGQGTEPER